MQTNAKLTINLNEEYKIRIEKGKEFEASIFNAIYLNAANILNDIIRHFEQNKDSIYDDFNNILAFIGERGKGKSSSMISFRDAIVNKENPDHRPFFNKKSLESLKKINFASIDIVDPSLFRGEESLFEIILAKMFQKFQTSINQDNFTISQDDKRTLIKYFQDVFENLQIINSNKQDIYKKESIEVLSKLATSSNLKESFKKLVDIYLDRFETKKDFLIITIDDFDLSFSNTYVMLEDIRRFFIQSRIIILISYNKNQLFSSISNYFKSGYTSSSDELNNRTSKYLEKLIPISRTIEIPNFNLKDDNNTIKEIQIQEFGEVKGTYPFGQYTSINNLYNFLIFYISSNLNLFVTNYKFRQNLFIPKTLRETKELIKNIHLSDVKLFKKYLILKSYNELDPKFSKLFDIAEENKSISLLIVEQYLIDSLLPDTPLAKYIDTTNSDHLSVGDVISLFEFIDRSVKIINVDVLKFIDYVRIFLSLDINEKELKASNRFIYNGFEDRFPRENNSFRRDWVKFNIDIKISDYRNNDAVFLIYSLIHIYGDSEYQYRKSTNNYFFRFFENFNRGVLDPFSIFTNYIEIKKQIKRDNRNYTTLINLFLDYDDSFIKRLQDPSFAQEFMNGVSNYAFDYKERLPDYFNLIFIYLYEGGLKTLKKLSEQHEYIVDDGLIKSFIDFPIFKIWMIELESTESLARNIINEMYDSSKSEIGRQSRNELKAVISEYIEKDLRSSRTRNNFRRKIESIDPRSNAVKWINEFSRFYASKNIDQESKERELTNLKTRLTKILNG